MATKLTKSVFRETTEKVGDKEIIITLTDSQEIELKLKGKRGQGKRVGILELYKQLYEFEEEENKVKKGDDKMISLHDLRSQNAISTLDLETMVKFDSIITNLLETYEFKR